MQIVEKHCDPLLIECKLIQLPWKTICQYLSTAEMHICFHPKFLRSSKYPMEMVPYVWNNSNKMVYWFQIFIESEVWKQHTWMGCLNKLWCTHTIE